jgi:DNA primase small subunit
LEDRGQSDSKIGQTTSFREKDAGLLKSAFREYYFKHSKLLQAPEKMEQREFGFMHFGSGMIRHEKQLIAADLIFDIDGKDLELPCEKSHTYLICSECKNVTSSQIDSHCEFCKSGKLVKTSIPCINCTSALKKEVKRLINILTGDLGLADSSIFIYFSGNNGYHIHVLDPSLSTLDSHARSDLAGYVMGRGFVPESLGVRKAQNSFSIKFPKSGTGYGWRKRISDKLKIDSPSSTKLSAIVTQNGGYDGFKKYLDSTSMSLGVRIDPQVTTDIHRVFRMPGTLNSKSGLTKLMCLNLDSFDPFDDACLLGDNEVNVELKTSVKLRLCKRTFNIKKQHARLPTFAAVYLLCKGLASIK